jgi:peptidoglycan/xylan/chitin deacetylase (PgdA/CDA1 family)
MSKAIYQNRISRLALTLFVYFSFAIKLLTAADMCVTIDDLPVVRPASVQAAKELTAKLLQTITAEKIPAVGFVNQIKLEQQGKLDPAMVDVLKMWLNAGLELGNHSYSHMDLHKSSAADFEQDVIRGEAITKQLLKEKGKELRYFRHPYLHTGTDLETKHRIEKFLSGRGYTIAPVTIDNAEWIFALAYEKVSAELKPKVAESYISYMSDKIAFFEKESQQLIGRNIKHILLIHANQLNADHLPELIRMIRTKGYAFITLSEALQDKAYRLPDSFTGVGGISWLHRWAISRGVNKDFFKGEPIAPPFIMEAAGVEEE